MTPERLNEFNEPWTLDGPMLKDKFGNDILWDFADERPPIRIIACVNACAGIKDPSQLIAEVERLQAFADLACKLYPALSGEWEAMREGV